MSDASNLVLVCKTGDVAEGEAIRVEVQDLALAVFNVGGSFYVTDDLCTHGPGLLHEGYIDGDVVECNFHNGAFHIPTGKPVAPPCNIPLRTFSVTLRDGQVFINPSGTQAAEVENQ